jgi:hypothetical protein
MEFSFSFNAAALYAYNLHVILGTNIGYFPPNGININAVFSLRYEPET